MAFVLHLFDFLQAGMSCLAGILSHLAAWNLLHQFAYVLPHLCPSRWLSWQLKDLTSRADPWVSWAHPGHQKLPYCLPVLSLKVLLKADLKKLWNEQAIDGLVQHMYHAWTVVQYEMGCCLSGGIEGTGHAERETAAGSGMGMRTCALGMRLPRIQTQKLLQKLQAWDEKDRLRLLQKPLA